MKIFPVSDLHLERFYDYRLPVEQARLGVNAARFKGGWGPPDADVVVACGDIHLDALAPGWLPFLYLAPHILYLPGNHEYYGQRLDEHDQLLLEQCKKQGVQFLQGSEVQIGDVVFLGVTWWTDFSAFAPKVGQAAAGRLIEQHMADFELIKTQSRSRGSERTITWYDILRLHQAQHAWLRQSIEKNRGQKMVVATHHAPSLLLGDPRYAQDPTTAGWCNRADAFVTWAGEQGVRYWLCGHSHSARRAQIGKVLVVNNAVGDIEFEASSFDPLLVLEI